MKKQSCNIFALLYVLIQQLKSSTQKINRHNKENIKNKIYSERRDYPDKRNKLFHFADIDKRMKENIALKTLYFKNPRALDLKATSLVPVR